MTIKSGSSAFNILDYACSYKPEKAVETKADPKAAEEGDNATEGKGEAKPTTPKR
jgi:hypothetical protein